LTNDIPKHGASYRFVSGLYHGDELKFQVRDLGDSVGLAIEVSEDGDAFEVTLTLEQLGEFAGAMYAALNQAVNLVADQHTRRLLGLIRSGIGEHPAKGKDGA
jgi:hypothetical protein